MEMSNLAQIASILEDTHADMAALNDELEIARLARIDEERAKLFVAQRHPVGSVVWHKARPKSEQMTVVHLPEGTRNYIVRSPNGRLSILHYSDVVIYGDFGDIDPYADWQPEQHGGWRGD